MKTFHIAALTTALCLSGAFTSVAALQGPPGKEEHRNPEQPPVKDSRERTQPQPQSRPEPAQQPQPGRGNDRPGNDRPGDDNNRGRQGPPSDFGEVRGVVQQNRHQIGRGGSVPSHVRIVKGKRLPSGWGRRLTAEQLRPLPRYEGYEWRRLGSDMLLVDTRTLIVFEILRGVLD